jgi:KDO2-lipid IV(A) lauroyltransferase
MLVTLRVLRWLVARLPVWFGRWLAMRAGDVAYYFATRGRRAAISNMRHVLGPQARWSEVRRAAHRVFQNVGLVYYDLLRVPDLSDEALRREVVFDEAGFRPIRAFIHEGQPMIMVSAHYGSVDMAGRVLQAYGWKVAMLADQVGGNRLFQFIRGVRERSGAEMLPHEEGVAALRRLIRTLQAGRTIGMLLDRNATVEEKSGVHVPFFGQDIVMTSALARLALRSKGLVVPAFCYREGGKYVIRIHAPIAPTATDEPERDVETLTRKVAAIYEQYIRHHPEQWLLLSPVWADSLAEPVAGA